TRDKGWVLGDPAPPLQGKRRAGRKPDTGVRRPRWVTASTGDSGQHPATPPPVRPESELGFSGGRGGLAPEALPTPGVAQHPPAPGGPPEGAPPPRPAPGGGAPAPPGPPRAVARPLAPPGDHRPARPRRRRPIPPDPPGPPRPPRRALPPGRAP